MNWFPFYHGDYLRDTMSLNAEEHGIYLLLLMRFFSDGPLPDDIDELALTARTASIEKLRKILTRYWELSTDGWTNAKMAEVRERQALKHQARVDAGRRGGLAKSSNARNLLEQTSSTDVCSSNALASTRTNSVTNVTDASASDLKGQVWNLGADLLGSRAMVGKLVKEHGEARVFHAIAECVNKKPADPRSYIGGLLRAEKPAALRQPSRLAGVRW